MIRGIAAAELARSWPTLLPLVEKGVAEGDGLFNAEDYRQGILRGMMQAWRFGEPPTAVLITEIVKFPRKTAVNLLLCGGMEMEAWIDQMDVIEAWAKAHKCDLIRIPHGRPGWERTLKGFRRTGVVLSKETRP